MAELTENRNLNQFVCQLCHIKGRGVPDIALCHKDCHWLATGGWFSPVSYTNKTDHHDINCHIKGDNIKGWNNSFFVINQNYTIKYEMRLRSKLDSSWVQIS
jgi:hypothetical protein